jgi:universal stress protein E
MPTPSSPPKPLTRLLVATDFSPGSRWAMLRAAQLPLAPRARVAIVHVLEAEGAPSAAVARTAAADVGRRLRRVAEQFTADVRARGLDRVRAEPVVVEGQAFVRIVQLARRRRAELVVVGPHGKRTVRDLLLGTTAQRVARKSPVPVLLVKREPEGPYERPLVATDLEAGWRHVLEMAWRVLEPGVDRVTLLHACHPPFEGWIFMGTAPGERHRWRRAALRGAATRVETLRQDLGAEKGRVQPRVRYGDPRNVIGAEAARTHADLVVVGSHRRIGLARVLLGRVAERIAQALPCDVLIVRHPELELRLP